MVSPLVAPIASEPSRIACGTAAKASSDSDEMNGISMMPITPPAAIALFGATSRPILMPACRSAGATVRTAKKP